MSIRLIQIFQGAAVFFVTPFGTEAHRGFEVLVFTRPTERLHPSIFGFHIHALQAQLLKSAASDARAFVLVLITVGGTRSSSLARIAK
jgi:hypothetical protein